MPGADRSEEVRISQQILQSLGIRSFMPQVTSCPGCGRTTSTYFQELADEIQNYMVEMMPVWKEIYPGVEEKDEAAMGCIVSGTEESRHEKVGNARPGTVTEHKSPDWVARTYDVT